LSDRLGRIGVAVGLAWTPVGGEVMVVEASKMPGDGKLILTGQLGDVMKESATIALNWVRSNEKQVCLSCIKYTRMMFCVMISYGFESRLGHLFLLGSGQVRHLWVWKISPKSP